MLQGFNPMDALHELFHDLIMVTDKFMNDPDGDPREYLKASDGVFQTVTAVINTTFTTIVASTYRKVPKEILEEHVSWMKIRDELESPEDKRERHLRSLERFHADQPPLDEQGRNGILAGMPKEIIKSIFAADPEFKEGALAEAREIVNDPDAPPELKAFLRELFGELGDEL